MRECRRMENWITNEMSLRHLGIRFDCDLGLGGRELLTFLFIFHIDLVESAPVHSTRRLSGNDTLVHTFLHLPLDDGIQFYGYEVRQEGRNERARAHHGAVHKREARRDQE